jgi:hypothetical protein
MAKSPVQYHIQSKNQYWYRVQSSPGTVSGLAESTSPGPSSRDLVWYSNFWYQYQHMQAHQKGQVAGSRTARTPEAEFLDVILLMDFIPPPPHSLSKSDLKLACNVNIVYQNQKSLIKLKIVPRNFSEILRPRI